MTAIRNPEGGEGDRRSARRYNEAATDHAESGEVDAAAREAAEAVEAAPKAHREAEIAGKSRMREEAPALTEETSHTPTSLWGRMKRYVRRQVNKIEHHRS